MTNVKKVRWLVVTLVLVVVAFFIGGSYSPNNGAVNEPISKYEATTQKTAEVFEVQERRPQDVEIVNISTQVTNAPDVSEITKSKKKTKEQLEREEEFLRRYILNRDEDGNRIHPELSEEQKQRYIKKASEVSSRLKKIEEADRKKELESEIDYLRRYLYNQNEDGSRMHPTLSKEQGAEYINRIAEAESELRELEKK